VKTVKKGKTRRKVADVKKRDEGRRSGEGAQREKANPAEREQKA